MTSFSNAPTNNYETPQDGSIFLPCRVDVCLPGTPDQLLPIPLDRVYNVEDRRLVTDCFQILNYTVELLLDLASHLSPTERERLAQPPCAFVHPETGLLVHSTERSFANFAVECILTQHNSTQAIVLSPSWPSVFFDDDGYPYFGEKESKSKPSGSGVSLAGKAIPITEEMAFEKEPQPRQFVPPPAEPKSKPRQPQQYVPKPSRKRRHVLTKLEKPPDEWVTLTFPRL